MGMTPLARDSFRIVHVEDDDSFAELTAIFLARAGFGEPVVRFSCGTMAVDYLSKIDKERAPHAILLDLNMPGMGGLEVLHWVRNYYGEPDIPVYMLTSSDDPRDMRQAADAGVTKYFFKMRIFEEGVFVQLIQELDQVAAMMNFRQPEKAGKKREAMSELARRSKASTSMVILADTAGRIMWVNEPFVRTTGYTLAEIHGLTPGRLLRGPDSNPSAIARLDRAVLSATGCECRSVNYRKDGRPYPVRISLQPVFSQGRHEGFFAAENEETSAKLLTLKVRALSS